MPSEKIVEVVSAIKTLQDRVAAVDGEAKRLVSLRGDIKSLSEEMSACSRELQSVAAALAAGAATMRELDMAATLERITQIEEALDDRSDQLERAIDKDIAELGDSILNQLSTRLDAVAERLEPIVATAFGGQMAAITEAIGRVDSAAQERHEAGVRHLQSETAQLAATQAEHGRQGVESMMAVRDGVGEVLGATQGVVKELGDVRQSIVDLKRIGIDPIADKIERQAQSSSE
jgi:chromosome segregation ATPase